MIDKPLYNDLTVGSPEVIADGVMEIHIIDPDEELEEEPEEVEVAPFDENLADKLDEEKLQTISQTVLEEFEADLLSRQEWIKRYTRGIELLGLKYEERTKPWAGACGLYNPMITEAATRFQSEVITETFPAAGPVKTTIIGEETKEKLAAASRVAEDMNYRLTEEMVEYRAEHERMLWALPISGAAFKKIYFDPLLNRQVSIFCPAEDVIIPYGAAGVNNAERITHIMRKPKGEVDALMDSKLYRSVDLGDPTDPMDSIEKEKADATGEGDSISVDNRYKILEIQASLRIEEDKGELLPYVITIEKSSGEVLAIRRNYDERTHARLTHFVQYNYVPGFGAYGLGLIHLIGGYAEAATSLTRQLVDSGTLANLPGGLKSRGLRMNKGDDGPIAPGEFRDVDVPGNSIRDNILPLPYKEPSPTLYNLLKDVVQEGKNFINASDLNIADMSGQAPVGTTLALLERKLKVMSAIQARIHASMKQEFKLLKKIICEMMPDEYAYDVEKADREVKKSDYGMCEIIPVSDPNASTMAHKVILMQTVTQMAQQAPPGTYDMKVLHRSAVEVLGIKNADKLVPLEDDIPNVDPVTENQNILMTKPVKAYQEQDHEAHIAVHAALLQDPQLQQWMQTNPGAQAIVSQLQAHLAAHYGMQFRQQVETQMGIPIPKTKDGEALPEEIEVAVSRMAAEATKQVLQTNQARAAQEEALKQAQDPMIQMQQQELEQEEKKISLKEREIALKEKQVAVDAAHKADQTELGQASIESREKIAAMQVGAKVAYDKEKMEGDQEATGLKAGIEIAKTITQGANRNGAANSEGNKGVKRTK